MHPTLWSPSRHLEKLWLRALREDLYLLLTTWGQESRSFRPTIIFTNSVSLSGDTRNSQPFIDVVSLPLKFHQLGGWVILSDPRLHVASAMGLDKLGSRNRRFLVTSRACG